MNRYLRTSRLGEVKKLDRSLYGGVSFGAEFCPGRLPTLEAVREARLVCAEKGVAFSLVTPLAREAQFDAVARWLLDGIAPGEEWTANDWGVLTFAHSQRLGNPCTAGRLLSRQRRDHRTAGLIAAAADEREAEDLRAGAWSDPEIFQLLRFYGVARVELDALPWGVARPASASGVGFSLCAPWVPVTLSPSCPWSENPLDCSAPCAGATPVRLENDEDPMPLWSCGNTLFLKAEKGEAESQAESLGADRFVWAETVPG
jgi:hypothetical protein